MAKGDQEEGGKEQESKPKGGGGGGLVKILIVVILVLLLAVAGVLVYSLVFKSDSTSTQDQSMVDPMGGSGQQAQARPATAEPGPIVSYTPFLVNLADPGGQRYLRIQLSLELSRDRRFVQEVEAKEPRIKDIIISILSSKTFDEIATTQGKIALRQEILRRLNTIMSGGRIVDVYITEFIVQ